MAHGLGESVPDPRAVYAEIGVPDVHLTQPGRAIAAQACSGQLAGYVRTDLSVPTLTSWIILMLDGYLGRLAADHHFSSRTQRRVLIDAVTRFLAIPDPP